MSSGCDRRQFLGIAATVSTAAALGEWTALQPISPARAEVGGLAPDLVRFSPETEPIIKLILDTPREKCIATMVERFRNGMPYRHFLAALYLTAVRVGPWHNNSFDHAAYAIHSAHQLSLDLPPHETLLPALWALDSLKSGSPRPGELPIQIRGTLPPPEKAADELRAGVECRDEERAARAVIALCRANEANRVGELLWEHAGRDWTFIGHLAILVSNSWRLLQTIGWQHAEPVLRYVVSGLTGAAGSKPDLLHFPENAARVDRSGKRLPGDWAGGDSDPEFTRDLLVLVRERKAGEASDLIAARLAAGKVKAGAVWDAVFLAAGEMIECAQKNSTPLHANTVANALRYAFGESGEPRTRLLVLLQAVAWMIRFRDAMAESGWLKDATEITSLTAGKPPANPAAVAAEILSKLSHGGLDHGEASASPVPGWHGLAYNNQPWRHAAAAKVFALAQQEGGADALFRAAAGLLPAKADGDPHRIKFATAMLENCRWISAPWRPHLVAAASYSFLGADAPDTPTIRAVREALGKS